MSQSASEKAEVIRMVSGEEFEEEYRGKDDWTCNGYRHPEGRHYAPIDGTGYEEVTAVTAENVQQILDNEEYSYPGMDQLD